MTNRTSLVTSILCGNNEAPGNIYIYLKQYEGVGDRLKQIVKKLLNNVQKVQECDATMMLLKTSASIKIKPSALSTIQNL